MGVDRPFTPSRDEYVASICEIPIIIFRSHTTCVREHQVVLEGASICRNVKSDAGSADNQQYRSSLNRLDLETKRISSLEF
jgi:hypothetical protein